MVDEYFNKLLLEKNIMLTVHQLEQFEKYYQLLIEWNAKINLTAITDYHEVFLKHFYDSLSLAFFQDLNQAKKIVDIGAGAGFPSLPLKILYPHLEITIVDSLNKRINFLQTLVEQIELKAVTLYHGRAEDGGQKINFREQFDLALARAVAHLSILSEYCLPYVKVNGQFVAYKGSNINLELQESQKSINLCGGVLNKVHVFDLPQQSGERHLICINKIKKTPAIYPRKAGIPKQKPL